jgi:TonB family protein
VSAFYEPPESLLESRGFRRLLAFSLAGHVLLFVVLTFRPPSHATLISPSPVMVSMVDMPKPAAPAAVKKPAAKPPPPKPEPKPEPPPPPKPVVDEVVIPKELKPLPTKPKPVPKPVEKAEPTKSAEELLAELTKKVEERNPTPEPVAKAEPGPAAPIAGGPGTFDPLLSPWVARVESVVRANWSGAQLCKGVPTFDIDVEASGALNDISLAKTSGDRFCDESAERALRKSNPLPPPPQAMALRLNLHPEANR